MVTLEERNITIVASKGKLGATETLNVYFTLQINWGLKTHQISFSLDKEMVSDCTNNIERFDGLMITTISLLQSMGYLINTDTITLRDSIIELIKN